MRTPWRGALLCGFFALLATGCARSQPQAARAGCAFSATHEMTWSDAARPDSVTTTSQGPSCAQAVVILVLRDADGDPLWTLASTYMDMSAGGIGAEGAPPVSEEEMQSFLASWADLTLNHSGDLPAWPEGAAALGEGAEGVAYSTAFDREAYEALRARNLPQACYAAAADATQCLVIDPISHAPTMIAAFGA